MIEVLDSDYMLLAESKGISGPALIFRHALRNALIPIITVLAPLIVDLMTGSLVVEKIFAIPGVGKPAGHGHPVQRLQRGHWPELYLQRHVHWHHAGR